VLSYILTLVVAALNLLSDVPGVPAAPTTAIKVYSAVFGVVSIAILMLATQPEARRAYR